MCVCEFSNEPYTTHTWLFLERAHTNNYKNKIFFARERNKICFQFLFIAFFDFFYCNAHCEKQQNNKKHNSMIVCVFGIYCRKTGWDYVTK